MQAGDWGLADIQGVVAQVLSTDSHVLAAGEVLVARRMLALEGSAGRLWAWLVGRTASVFRVSQLVRDDVEDVSAALALLKSMDLVHGSVPEKRQLHCYTVRELRGICRRLGLPSVGRRAALEEHLGMMRGWACEPVIRVAGGALLRRFEALCFQDRRQDRSVWLLERLGVVHWPTYERTERQPGFVCRSSFMAWVVPFQEHWTPEEMLEGLVARRTRPRWQAGLCLRRRFERHLVQACRGLERSGEHVRAARLYEGLLESGASDPGEVVGRLALAREASGNPAAGLEAARRWRSLASPVSQLALDRIGRRLARRAPGGWPPAPPLRKPRQRQLKLERAASLGARSLWGDPPLPIESAVLRAIPRRGIAAENALWTTLYGLLLYDLFWLPVPGMLPRRNLDGPLDLGTPDFARHRRQPLQQRLEALATGSGPALLHEAWRHHGERIRGVDWRLATRGTLEACVVGVGGPALAVILGRLAEEGWAAAAGLPDLAVLPGPEVSLPRGFPRRLGESLFLVEVKGPGDTVRDAQAVWFDRLLAAGARVELWRVGNIGAR